MITKLLPLKTFAFTFVIKYPFSRGLAHSLLLLLLLLGWTLLSPVAWPGLLLDDSHLLLLLATSAVGAASTVLAALLLLYNNRVSSFHFPLLVLTSSVLMLWPGRLAGNTCTGLEGHTLIHQTISSILLVVLNIVPDVEWQ